MPETNGRTGPLSHIRVLDLGRIMAAPWATQILADLGADVIKIERPGAGDDTRSWGPPFLKDGAGAPTREAGYFLSVNRGKRSVTVDVASPKGQEVVRALAATADVVVENFKAGALARYGLDAASLRGRKPSLIYCSVTGFGQDGPRADQAAYDFAIQAMCGLMSITGERDDQPGGGPQKVGVPIVDLMTGMYATVAILAALVRRAETGEGETIDLAMLDVGAAMLANQAMNHLITGRIPQRGGNRHPNIQPQDVFAAKDGFFVLAVGNDGQFGKLCAVLGKPEWASDVRFSSNPGRVQANADLTALLAAAFDDWSRDALVAALDAAGVPAAPINTIDQVFADPQLQHRGMLQHLPHPLGGTVPQVVSPIRMQDAPAPLRPGAALVGRAYRRGPARIGPRRGDSHVSAQAAVPAGAGPRVPMLTAEEMTPEQRCLYDAVVAGPRGEMIGPLRAAIHSPELATLWSQFGEFLRFRTCLPPRLNELAIVVTGRRWTSQVEWWVHARACVAAGVPQAAVDAIGALQPPQFDQAADLEVYDFATLLQQTGRVPDEVYGAVLRRWGTRGVVELGAVIGYYTMVSMTLNAHQLPLPKGAAGLPPEDGLVMLPPGAMAHEHEG